MSSWRENAAHWLRRMGNRIAPDEAHEIELRDANGDELLNVMFSGGFCLSHPPEDSGLKVYCRHGDELDEL